MKLRKQITAIVLIIAGFALFDISVYTLFTRRYINSQSEQMKAKSVELDKYLPFDDDSKAVKHISDTRITCDLPVIDGAAALFPVCSSVVWALYPEDSVHFDGTDLTADSALHYTNTRGAYKAVADGEADIIFCAAPSAEQEEYARSVNADLELVPIGYEAFVFIVNKDNPVDSLTVEQVRDIYAGKYRKWSELGGSDKYIDAVQRNEGSGSQTAMLSFMNGTPIKHRFSVFNASAIGFSFRYYVEELASSGGVKMLALNGAYPDKENVANGSYPLVSSFYAVYDKNDTNENIRKVIDFVLSEEGQKIIEESGYIPIG